jgi:hypothetical protein
VTNLRSPSGKNLRVSITAYGDNFRQVQSNGTWITWH